MKWENGKCSISRLTSLFLVTIMISALVISAPVYAAGPRSPGESIQIVAKAGFSSQQGKSGLMRNFKGQQFTRITGTMGEPPENRYAIVIGSNYTGSTSEERQIPLGFGIELACAEFDAQDITGLLGAPPEFGGYGFDVTPLIGEDASRSNILDAIEYVKAQAQEDDEVVFYYSGHGAEYLARDREEERESRWARGWQVTAEGMVTDEGSGNNVDFIWDYQLREAFSGFATDRIVFTFDCCLAGGLTELAEDGRLVLMATTENGIAAEIPGDMGDGVPINHGLFTYFLLGALSGAIPEADSFDHDGDPAVSDVTVEEAFNFASYVLIESSPMIKEVMAWMFGPDVAAHWGTPVISDWFTWDLSL